MFDVFNDGFSELDDAGVAVLAGQLHDAVVVADPTGRVLLTNRPQEPAPPGIAVNLRDPRGQGKVFRPNGVPYADAELPLARALRSGEVIAGEELIRFDADGSRRSFDCNSGPVRDREERIVAAVSAESEVTDRDRAEAALEEAAGRLVRALEGGGDEFVALDERWGYAYVNERALRAINDALGTSFTREALASKTVWDLFPAFGETAVFRQLELSRAESRPVQGEAFREPDRRWVEVRAFPWDGGVAAYTSDVTERRASERAQAFYASLLANVEDGVVVTAGEDFRITGWNAGAERLYGFSAEEVLGRPARDVAGDPGDALRRTLERELREAGRSRTEFTARRKDGAEVEVELLAVTVKDDSGAVSGHLGIHRDITESKRTETQLRAARRRSEEILESIDDAFFAIDREWRYTYLNTRAVRQVGDALGREVTADELLGRNCWETFPEWAGTQVSDAFERALREQTTVELEVHVGRMGRWLEARLYPSPGGLSTYLRDVTDRKRGEEQLRSHASLLENMDDAVLATDPNLVLSVWNGAAERMFGWTAAEAVGRRVDDLIPTAWTEREVAGRLRRLAETGRVRVEGTWYAKGGEPVEAEAITVALRSGAAEVTGYLSIMRDIGERRRATGKLETAAREHALLADLSLRGLGSGDIQPLLDDAVSLVAEVLEVELTSIAEPEPAGSGFRWRAAFGWRKEVVATAPACGAGPESLVGYTMMVGEPVTSEDLARERRFRLSELFAQRQPASAAAVVIPGVRHPFGVLSVASTRRRRFDADDVGFLQAVANVVGVALERSKADAQLQAAREAERTRIARELHDDGLRELNDALGIAASARSPSAQQPDEERWSAMASSLQRLSWQLRSAIYDLRLGGVERRPFTDLLDDLVAVQAELAVDCRVELRGRETLPAGSLGHRGTEVLRIIREAVTNARRHSGARTIRLDAGRSTPDVLRIEISDDGRWPDRDATVSTRAGTGIIGMFERAVELRAELRFEGAPGGGTTVSLEVLLPDGGPRD